jgi:hypothetical protein
MASGFFMTVAADRKISEVRQCGECIEELRLIALSQLRRKTTGKVPPPSPIV